MSYGSDRKRLTDKNLCLLVFVFRSVYPMQKIGKENSISLNTIGSQLFTQKS